jgi:hypothetical protein
VPHTPQFLLKMGKVGFCERLAECPFGLIRCAIGSSKVHGPARRRCASEVDPRAVRLADAPRSMRCRPARGRVGYRVGFLVGGSVCRRATLRRPLFARICEDPLPCRMGSSSAFSSGAGREEEQLREPRSWPAPLSCAASVPDPEGIPQRRPSPGAKTGRAGRVFHSVHRSLCTPAA